MARNLVKRGRLFDVLDTARSTPVLLVSAPAGSGKSLLVASWWADRDPPHKAWVNLLTSRHSASQVWRAILQALAVAAPEGAEELTALETLAVRAPQDLPARLGRWLTGLDHDVHLVVDELHTVTDMLVHEQLIELIAAAASRLRMVAIARHDPPWPLHRMRLDGLLDSVRAESLAFDDAEAAELFAELGMPASAERISQLVTRTQGWAAGLRLAAIGASTAPDPDAYLAAVSGRDEYIADYLLHEVYAGLGLQRRDFLARIGVVDEISAELAEALGAGPDSDVQLAELARQNAFIHQLGDRHGWYRLHPLLVDFLRSRALDDSQRRLLHSRAARWFDDHGEARLAMTHALAASDWDLASDLAGTHVVSWTVRRPPTEVKRLLSRVPWDVTLTRPGLALCLAAALSMLGEPADIPELVAATRSQLEGVTGVRRQRYEFVLGLIGIGSARWAGDLDALLATCRRLPTDPAALGALDLTDWVIIRTLVLSNRGAAELWTGQLPDARIHLAEAARVDPSRTVGLPTLNAQAHLAYLHWVRGELVSAQTAGRAALDGLVRLGEPGAVQARCARLALAGVAVDRDDLCTAERWLDMADGSAREPHTAFAAGLMAARLQGARGHLFDAVAAVRAARRGHQGAPLPPALLAHSHLLEAELLVVAGNSQAAREAVASSGGVSTDQVAADGDSIRARVRRHLAAVRRNLSENRRDEALSHLEAALSVAAPERLRQPFLTLGAPLRPLLSARIAFGTREPDFAADLLGRTGDQPPRTSKDFRAVLVPLTAREKNILRYLATTLTTKEIAQALYVSTNTVKTHQRSIHQKLGAGDRREAVAHARDLGLL